MYQGRKQPVAIPSDAQAREKLVVYVYEYLHHMGAKSAADTFLQEINWQKGQISPNESPGFLHSWWCVFWDLYCAAPERRETHPHSKEASSFHDYNMSTSGHPLSPNMNGMGFAPGQGPPPHLQHSMGDGGPVPVPSPSLGHQLGGPGGDGMPPGFFQNNIRPPSQMMSHGGIMHSLAGQQQPSNLPPHHPGHPSQLQQGQPPPGPPTPGGHMQNGPMGSHPGMGMIMQPGGSPFMSGPPRGYGGPNANRQSPGSRMVHPGQQQMEFGGPPGSMMMSEGGPPQGMMIGRSPGGMARGMPPSPMPPGAYGPPGGMQRMHNPGLGPGGSPSNPGGMGMPSMHQQQQRAWHQGPMGHYSSPPSPPNGSYMSMMGPPPHMQSPSQESVLSGGADNNVYGMMKVADRYGNSINDGSMQQSMGPGCPLDMGQVSLNGDGSMEMKHSPSVNGSSTGGGPGQGQNMDNDDYGYSAGQGAAQAASS